MLNYINAFSGFSVDDLAEAKAFYSEILGLKVDGDQDAGALKIYLNDNTTVFAYPKSNHQPATCTILNFEVEDIEKAVKSLKDQGVDFENYPGMNIGEDGISRTEEGPLIAWFTDPAGNIISVLQT